MKDLIGNTLLNEAETQARAHDDEGTTSNETERVLFLYILI